MFPKKDFFKILSWIFLILVVYFTTPFIFEFFKPVIFGFIISLILYPLSKGIEKKFKFLSSKWSLSLVVVFLLGLCSFIFYLLGSFIGTEIVGLYNNLPEIIADTQVVLYEITDFLAIYIPNLNTENIVHNILPNTEDIVSTISNLGTPIMDFGKSLPSTLINIIFTLLFSFFFTLNFSKVKETLQKIIPENIWEKVSLVLKNVIGGYFLAQGKLLCIMFVVLFIGFMIMDLDYAIILSLLVGLLDLLPFFGTGTFLGPFGIYHFFKGQYDIVLGCIIIYFITFVIRRVLEPKLLGDSIGVSSFFSLFCMFIGYKLMGLLGFILGVPVGVILVYLIKSDVFKPLLDSLKNIFNYFYALLK